MSRSTDLRWFEKNRKKVATAHSQKWVVVYNKEVVASFDTEEEAILFSLQAYGIDAASVFFADTADPVSFAG